MSSGHGSKPSVSQTASQEPETMLVVPFLMDALTQGLWNDERGAIRARFSEPASAKLQEIFHGVVRDAGAQGFVFREPALSQTILAVEMFIPQNSKYVFYGRYFSGPNLILVNQQWTNTMTDTELRVLLAHELGHGIDAQTQRLGHPVFSEIYNLSTQEFADHIARLITGDEAVNAFQDAYVLPSRQKRLPQ